MAAFLQHMAPQGLAAAKVPTFVGAAKTQAAGRAQEARNVRAKAVDRPVWYPGNDPPAHLDGSLPGDYGFDPLSLGSDPELLKWFIQAEIIHGRWAMTATAGILIPSVAAKTGVVDIPEWYDAGKVFVENTGIPLSTLLTAQIFLMNWAEVKRYYDFKNPGSQGDGSFLGFKDAFAGKGNGYPGGMFFDPFGLAKGDPETLKEYKVKEIKNGRLAMVAMAGFFAQYAATGKGPIDNLVDHIQSPYTTTFTSNGVSVPFLG